MPVPGPDPWPGPKSKTCAHLRTFPCPYPGARVPERATIDALWAPSSAHAHGEKLTRRCGVAIGVSDALCLVAVCVVLDVMRCCVQVWCTPGWGRNVLIVTFLRRNSSVLAKRELRATRLLAKATGELS